MSYWIKLDDYAIDLHAVNMVSPFMFRRGGGFASKPYLLAYFNVGVGGSEIQIKRSIQFDADTPELEVVQMEEKLTEEVSDMRNLLLAKLP